MSCDFKKRCQFVRSFSPSSPVKRHGKSKSSLDLFKELSLRIYIHSFIIGILVIQRHSKLYIYEHATLS